MPPIFRSANRYPGVKVDITRGSGHLLRHLSVLNHKITLDSLPTLSSQHYPSPHIHAPSILCRIHFTNLTVRPHLNLPTNPANKTPAILAKLSALNSPIQTCLYFYKVTITTTYTLSEYLAILQSHHLRKTIDRFMRSFNHSSTHQA